MHTTDDLKSQAKRLRKHFSTQGISLSHSQSLEAMAAAHGYKDWNVASAVLASQVDGSKIVTPELYQHLDALAKQRQPEAHEQQIPATTGGRIKSARYGLGLTQGELCEQAQTGVELVTLKRIESDRIEPSLSFLRALQRVGINPLWVMSGDLPMLTVAPRQRTQAERADETLELMEEIRQGRDALLSVMEKNPAVFDSDSPGGQALKKGLLEIDDDLATAREKLLPSSTIEQLADPDGKLMEAIRANVKTSVPLAGTKGD